MKWKYNNQYELFLNIKELDEIKKGLVYSVRTQKNDIILIRRET